MLAKLAGLLSRSGEGTQSLVEGEDGGGDENEEGGQNVRDEVVFHGKSQARISIA